MKRNEVDKKEVKQTIKENNESNRKTLIGAFATQKVMATYLVFATSAILSTGVFSYLQTQDITKEKNAVESKYETLDKSNKTLEDTYSKLKGNNAELNIKYDALSKVNASINKTNDSSQSEIIKQTKELAEYKVKLKNSKEELTQLAYSNDESSTKVRTIEAELDTIKQNFETYKQEMTAENDSLRKQLESSGHQSTPKPTPNTNNSTQQDKDEEVDEPNTDESGTELDTSDVEVTE